MWNSTLIKGKETGISEIQKLAEEKKTVLVKTQTSEFQIQAFELLSWQLRSLLRVKLYTVDQL